MDHSIEEVGVFFIGGCQKSGTTWLPALLSGHPEIACGGEGHFIDLLAPLMQKAVNEYASTQAGQRRVDVACLPTEGDLLDAVRVFIDAMLQRYIDRSTQPPDVRVVGDKTPEYATGMQELHRLYPHARFIHIIRDGRDAAVSGWAHLHRDGVHGQFKTFADYAGHFAQHHWRVYIEQARAAASMFPEQYLEVRYEKLRADPEANTRRMLKFLGVDDSDSVVRACVTAGSFKQLSGGRSAATEDRTSHFRKGIVGDWVNHFDDAAVQRFEFHAGSLMAELGYIASGAVAGPAR